MSVINIDNKSLDLVKFPKDFYIKDNTIFLNKNANILETITIKLNNQITPNLNIEILESANVKIILDIEDTLDKEIEYNVNLITHNNSQVKFLLVASVHNSFKTINFNSKSYNDSGLLFFGSLVSDKIDANFNLDLNGKGASVLVNTITVSAEDHVQNLDVHLTHHAPLTNADMNNIAIASKNGKVKLNGVGTIHQGMKNSNAFQTLKGIITSDLAEIDVNPILIIDEYDIKAGHAATVGKMEEEELYYLMSRGLSKKDAEKLIINGLLQPVIDEIDDELIKENVLSIVNTRI